jgi:hypothetical protein
MVLSGARPKGARQATGRGPGSADAKPHDAYRRHSTLGMVSPAEYERWLKLLNCVSTDPGQDQVGI